MAPANVRASRLILLFVPRASLLTLLASILWAQSSGDYLYPIRDGRKFGFINRAGKVVAPPQYDAVGEYREGRIAVLTNGLWGYIDLSGKMTIEPQYEQANEFHYGRAIVRNGSRYALIERSGKLVAEIPFRVLGSFHQGLLRVQDAGRVDESGKRVPTRYGFIDRDGRVVIPPTYINAAEFPDNPENLPFGAFDREWRYFDHTGKVIVSVPFGEHLNPANLFADGRLLVKDGFTWGYKDARGNWAIPAKFNDASSFERGLARVQDGEKWMFIDVNGREVPQEQLRLRPLEPFSEGLALTMENGLTGWVDQAGKLAFPLRKYEKAFKFSSGMARIRVDDLFGYLDRSGKLAIPAQYWAAADFDHDLAFVQTKDAIAYIDAKGAVVWQAPSRR